jgi:hypothetical protein
MNVYAVIATSQGSVEPIRHAVESAFVENYIAVGDMCWLVADPLDVRGVSRKLGVGEPDADPLGTLSNVIVIWAVSYWGKADVNIWAWISQKILQQPTFPVAQQPAK